jgi:hypothetical protein
MIAKKRAESSVAYLSRTEFYIILMENQVADRRLTNIRGVKTIFIR